MKLTMIIYLIQQIGNCMVIVAIIFIVMIFPIMIIWWPFFSTTWVTVSPWVECLVPRVHCAQQMSLHRTFQTNLPWLEIPKHPSSYSQLTIAVSKETSETHRFI